MQICKLTEYATAPGGVLTEAIRRRPYQVILLDEFEKAHRDVSTVYSIVFALFISLHRGCVTMRFSM